MLELGPEEEASNANHVLDILTIPWRCFRLPCIPWPCFAPRAMPCVVLRRRAMTSPESGMHRE